MIIYFSGTGNSRFAARKLAEQLGDTIRNAGEHLQEGESLHSDLPWVFVGPIYAWRMAKVLEEYIRRSEFSGSREAYFVLTCGGEIGNAAVYLETLCLEKGLHFRGTLEVVMPDNYIIMFKAPRTEEACSIVDKALPVLQRGGTLILQNEPFPVHKAGLLDRLKSGPINQGFYRFYVKADGFRSTERCTACGQCVACCPLSNIRLQEGRPIWGKDCTQCMACICSCPAEAIEYGNKTIGKVRYRCPED